MKKLLNKGFTLVELLAVIVVLAVIMIIVADRVGNAMRTSRGDSLLLQVKSMEREIDKICIVNNEITEVEIRAVLDGSGLRYMDDAVEEGYTFTAVAKKGSEFANIIVPKKDFSDIITGKAKYNKEENKYEEDGTVSAEEEVLYPIVTFNTSCPIATGTVAE